MWELLTNIFSPSQYMPHGSCYLWQTPLIWLHITSDLLIAIAYFSIPASLLYFIYKRRDIPLQGVFILFGAFIILCGTGHLLDIWTLWHPAYWLSGVERSVTALVSCYTAFQLITLLPKFLSLKTPEQLEAINRLNQELQIQLTKRSQAEDALRRANEELEKRVSERTAELSNTLGTLQIEIAEHRQVEKTLQFVTQAVESASDAIGITDLNGTSFYHNAAFIKRYGYTVEELNQAGGPAVMYTKPRILREIFWHIRKGEQSWSGEVELKTKSGEILQTEVRADCVKDSAGNSIGLIGVISDFTELKRTSLALKESQERLQMALWASDLGLWDWNIATGGAYFDRQWKKMLGYEEEEIENSYQSWKRLIHPEDLPGALDAIAAHIENETRTYELEFRMLTKSGEWRWISSYGKVMERDEYGVPVRMAGTHKDISERKLKKERLRLLEKAIAASSNGIAICDAQLPDNPLIYVNPAFESITGYSATEAIGKNCRFLQGTDKNQPALEELRSAIRSQKECRVILRNYRKDGSLFWNDFSLSCLRDASGRLTHYVGVQSDITEQQIATEALAKQFRRTLLLKQMSEEIRSSLEPKQIFETVAQQIGQLLSVDRCLFYIYIPNPEPKISLVAEFAVLAYQRLSFDELPVDGNPHLKQLLVQDVAISSPDVYVDPLLEKVSLICLQNQLKSMLAVRTSYQEEPNGVLCVQQCSYFRTWTLDEIDLLESIATQIGIAIAQAKLLQQEQQARAELNRQILRERLVATMLERIRSSLNLEAVLTTAVNEIRQFLSTDRTVIYRFYPDGRGVVSVESVGEDWMPILGLEIEDNCFAEKYISLYEQGRLRAIDDIYNNALEPCHIQTLEQLQVKANLVIPILQPEGNIQNPNFQGLNRLWGLLIAHHCSGPRFWQEFEIECLRQLSIQLAIALQQCTLFEQARTELTERKQAEAALRRSETREREKAEQLEVTIAQLKNTQSQIIQNEKMASLGQMVAGVAHEINNPVSFIYGNIYYAIEYGNTLLKAIDFYQQYDSELPIELKQKIQELELKFIKDDLIRLLTSIRTGADRIKEIVLSLRNFSRLDEADMKLANINEGIESTLMILQHRLKCQSDRAEIQVIKNYGELPPVQCYPGQLNQVFMNLLSNAIEALEEKLTRHPHSPAQIQIQTAVKDHLDRAALPTVVIRIADNGTGISEKLKNRIFDPFFTTKPVGKGTGLGLSISHQIIVEKHKGKLECYSQLGEGTEFIIELGGQ